MTRIFTEGFEIGDVLFYATTSGTIAANATYPRSGNYAARHSSGSLGSISISALSEFYFRDAIRIDDITAGKAIKWLNGSTELGSIRIAAGGTFAGYVGTGTLAGTGVINIYANTYYLVEVYIKIADSGGRLSVKIDGVQDTGIDFTGDTKPGSATTVDVIQTCGAVTGYTYHDDIALNSTAGGVDNSWCGDGRIIILTTNDNGDSSQFTGSDADSTDNYLLVDDIPSDGDTTYVESSTSGQKDLYKLTDCGLTSPTIHRVWTEARARDTVASGSQLYLVTKTNSSEYDGSALSLLTSYSRLLGTVYTTNPQSLSAWTTSELDNLQVGPKVV